MSRESAVYDTIGKTYDSTRSPDPYIVKLIMKYLCPIPGKKYLDIACGSGNYTVALHQQSVGMSGIDISQEMIAKAKLKTPDIPWQQGDAKALPIEDNSFDGATCILATHHIKDIVKAYQEAARVIKRGKFVIFTALPEQLKQYWLWEYFPQMMRNGTKVMHSFDEHKLALEEAGFSCVERVPFFITKDLQDWFLHAGKYRPDIYFDAQVRAGISSFHLSTNQDEIRTGLAKLKRDIESRKIQAVIDQYESQIGDYCFIVADKF